MSVDNRNSTFRAAIHAKSFLCDSFVIRLVRYLMGLLCHDMEQGRHECCAEVLLRATEAESSFLARRMPFNRSVDKVPLMVRFPFP